MKTFEVVINRISYGSTTIKIEADDMAQAERFALRKAGSIEYVQHSADYEVESIEEKD